MAKNLNSVSFIVLLLVLLVASTGMNLFSNLYYTLCVYVYAKKLHLHNNLLLMNLLKCQNVEILKSDAACFTFLGECGPEPFTGSNADCLACCVALYKSPPVCAGRVEGVPAHCHCYKS